MTIIEGVVLSTKMLKTVVVEVVRRTPHPLYRKLVKKSKKYKADLNGFEVQVGDKVKIAETRSMSKTKNFKIIAMTDKKEVLKTSKGEKK